MTPIYDKIYNLLTLWNTWNLDKSATLQSKSTWCHIIMLGAFGPNDAYIHLQKSMKHCVNYDFTK